MINATGPLDTKATENFHGTANDSDSATNDASHTCIPLPLPYSPLITRSLFALTAICHRYMSYRCIVAFTSPRFLASFPLFLLLFTLFYPFHRHLPFPLPFSSSCLWKSSTPLSSFQSLFFHFHLKSSFSLFSLLYSLLLPSPTEGLCYVKRGRKLADASIP